LKENKNTRLNKATLLIGSTLTVMAGAIVAPALPQISKEFSHLPNAELLSKLVLTLPALFMGVLAPIAGYIIDKSGRKKVLLFSLVGYAIAGTSGLYLDSMILILVGRALLGVSVGAMITAIITLIGDYFEGESRSRFVGLQAAFAGMGGLVFISSGGVLADIHWRMPFLIYIFSLVVWVMALISIYEPEMNSKTDNVNLNQNTKNTKKGTLTIVAWIYLIAFFSMIVFYMIPVQMPFMLTAMEGVTNTKVGFAIAFINVASVSTSVNYARFRKKLSFPTIMALVYLLVFIGYLIISQASSYLMMIMGIIVCGFGFGLMMPNINLWLISVAPAHLRGRMVGYLNTAVFTGMFFSPIALQPLIRFSDLYTSFFLVGIILVIISVLFLVVGLRSNKPK
jgi:MFS family permease